MIVIDLTKHGTVGLRGTGNVDRAKISSLPYVRRRNGTMVTWWTYVGDLRRDLRGCKIRWTERVKANLQHQLTRVEESKVGDDDEINTLFQEGKKPYQFQLTAIHFGLNEERVLIADSTGLGKQQPVDTKVLTPIGWRAIGDLTLNMNVIGSSGEPTRVTGVFPQGVKPSYRVTFTDGSSVEAGPEHLWAVEYLCGGRRWVRFKLTTQQLMERPVIPSPTGSGELDLGKTRLRIPMLARPARLSAGSPILPGYMVGAMIANGCLHHGTPQLVYGTEDWSEVSRRLYAEGADLSVPRSVGSTTRVNIRGVIDTVRHYEMNVPSAEKRIPTHYLFAPIQMRIALLHGLMDADGSISKTRNRVTYHTISRGLAEDVRELVEGLGGVATARTCDRTHEGKPVEFRVRIKTPQGIPPFSLRRKMDRYQPKSSQAYPSRTVKRVEYVRDVESVCISVDADDQLYTTEHCILTHNTIMALGILLTGIARGTIRRAMIVVPSGVKMQWYEEIHDFAKDIGKVVIARPGKHRKMLYRRDWQILIVNPDLVIRDVALIERIEGLDFVCLDEASCIRNPGTKIADAMKDLFARTRYRLALTATPVENKLEDLLSIMEFVDTKVFISRSYFESRYVIWKMIRFEVRTKRGQIKRVTKRIPVDYRHLNEVQVKVSPRYIRRRVSEVGLELPALVVQWERLKMTKEQRRIYEAVKQRTKEKIKGLRGAALLAPLQGLRQVCNSVALVQSGVKRPAEPKVRRLRELLETELFSEQVIVFTDYERFVQILAKRFKDIGVAIYTGKNKSTRNRELAAFKAGDKRVILATKALERGHNLQNASVVVNIDLPFNPGSIKQRLGRSRRLKSKHATTRMINFVCQDTIETSLIVKRLYAKRGVFEGVFGEDELSEADPLKTMNGSQIGGLL